MKCHVFPIPVASPCAVIDRKPNPLALNLIAITILGNEKRIIDEE